MATRQYVSDSSLPAPSVHEPAYCQRCGQPVASVNEDRTKFKCSNGHSTYLNPVPVGVGIIPVIGGGFVLIRRNIPPSIDKLAFPGGNATVARDIRREISREVEEEIGLPTDPSLWVPLDFESATGNGKILLFATYAEPVPADFPWKFSDREVSEVVIATSVPEDMAFPIHEDVLRQLIGL